MRSALLLPLLLAACSSSNFVAAPPTDAGSTAEVSVPDAAAPTPDATLSLGGGWSGSVKNESTTCPGGFGIGDVTAIRAVISQSGADLSIKVEGVAGFGFNTLFGNDTMTGSVAADKVTAKIVGTKELNEVTCKHRWKATLDGTVKGTQMTGTVIYTPEAISGECSKLTGCQRKQSFTMNKEPS